MFIVSITVNRIQKGFLKKLLGLGTYTNRAILCVLKYHFRKKRTFMTNKAITSIKINIYIFLYSFYTNYNQNVFYLIIYERIGKHYNLHLIRNCILKLFKYTF